MFKTKIVLSESPLTYMKKTFVAFPWVVTSTGPGGLMIWVFIIWREHPKAHRKWFYGVLLSLLIFVAVFLGCTSTGRVDLCFLWFYVQELPKAQLVVVLVLKRLRRRGNGLKSHPTDWEKPGIEPATPGLQDIGLSPTPRRLLYFCLYCPTHIKHILKTTEK